MSEENKQKLKEQQKNYRKAKKMTSKLFFFTWYNNGTKTSDF